MKFARVWVLLAMFGCAIEPAPEGDVDTARSQQTLAPQSNGGELRPLITPGQSARENYSLPNAACVSRGFPGGPRQTPCVIRNLRPNGRVASETRFDAAGHELSARAFDEAGNVVFAGTTTYRADGQRESASFVLPNESFSELWKYSDAGVLLEEQTHRGGHVDVTIYDRNASGTITGTRSYRDGVPSGTQTYFHDAAGRVLRIESRDSTGGLSTLETFEYFPDGVVARHSQERNLQHIPVTRVRFFDEAGRPVREETGADEQSSSTVWTYVGDRAFKHLQFSSSGIARDEWEELDGSQRPLRRLTRYFFWMPGTEKWNTDRFTYACETGELLLEEFDTDNDGDVDSSREHVYDRRGNLIEVRDLVPHPSRTVYDYSCH